MRNTRQGRFNLLCYSPLPRRWEICATHDRGALATNSAKALPLGKPHRAPVPIREHLPWPRASS